VVYVFLDNFPSSIFFPLPILVSKRKQGHRQTKKTKTGKEVANLKAAGFFIGNRKFFNIQTGKDAGKSKHQGG